MVRRVVKGPGGLIIHSATLAKKIGARATDTEEDGTPYYCVPIIYDPNTDTVVSDSFDIAIYLEKQYPNTRTLIPKGTEVLQAVYVDLIPSKHHAHCIF